MKKFKDILISIVILLIGIILIEITIRVINSDMRNYDIEMWKYAKNLKKKDSILGHTHRKNESTILQNVEIDLNSLGMRSEEPDPTKKKILFIGSSISLGWGVDKDSSYVGIFENQLKAENSDYQVLNASVGNYNTFRYVENFLRNQTTVNPEIMVVNYFINDVEMLPMGSDNWLLRNSALAASLNIAVKKIASTRNSDNLEEYYKHLYRSDNSGFKTMTNSLEKLSKYATDNNIKIYFAIIPDIHFLKNYPFLPLHNRIKNIAEGLNFQVIDFYSALKDIPFIKLQIIPGDSHPNSFGHRLIAKKLADSILPDLK
jgi:lysophospholipase L1-like esterase